MPAACVAVLVAWVPFRGESLPPLGVASAQGTIEILYGRCTDERVREVSVQVIDPDDGGGIVTGPMIWRIHSRRGLEQSVFTVGVAPPGSRTLRAAPDRLPRDQPLSIWVETTTSELLRDVSRQLRRALPGGRSDTLVTKAMLGIFGCVPAFDCYFNIGSGGWRFNARSLRGIHSFYEANSETIEGHVVPTLAFESGDFGSRRYTRAKVIDMIFFIQGAGLDLQAEAVEPASS